MTIALLGIDLAKNVFALHGLDDAGRTALKRPAVLRKGEDFQYPS